MSGEDARPGYYNGLYPTPTRLKLLKAISEGQGRIYFEANHVWDDAHGVKVTNRVLEMIGHKWITAEKVTQHTKRPGEIAQRTYYRLTELGESVLKGQRSDG
jgi:hypothetical protein